MASSSVRILDEKDIQVITTDEIDEILSDFTSSAQTASTMSLNQDTTSSKEIDEILDKI